jgi:hypothetical protein
VALLSMLQATLTLPGIAAIALTLGMAIDANVLINERVREELRGGASPQIGDPGRLRTRLGHHPGLQRDHADRRPGAAGLRLGPGARLRDRALPGHPDLDVLGGGVLARAGQPVVRTAEAPEVGVDRPGLAARGGGPPAAPHEKTDMEFFRIRRDIPFMRHALVLNVISLITFAGRGVLPGHARLHLSIEFTGGTVMEVEYQQAADLKQGAFPSRV